MTNHGPTDSAAWYELIRRAGIPARHGGATLRALVPLIDWDNSKGKHGQTHAGIERIAEEAGLCERTVRTHLDKLEACGVVERIGRKRRAIRRRVRYDRLAEMAAARNGKSATAAVETGNDCRSIPASTAGDNRQVLQSKPASTADYQSRPIKKPITPPTTTTNAADAAGGGGDSLLDESGNETHDVCESGTLLREFGVGSWKRIALDFAPEVIKAGISWIQDNGEGLKNQPGFLVSMLRNGEADAHAEVIRQRRDASERRRLATELEQREKVRERLLNALQTAEGDEADSCESALRRLDNGEASISEVIPIAAEAEQRHSERQRALRERLRQIVELATPAAWAFVFSEWATIWSMLDDAETVGVLRAEDDEHEALAAIFEIARNRMTEASPEDANAVRMAWPNVTDLMHDPAVEHGFELPSSVMGRAQNAKPLLKRLVGLARRSRVEAARCDADDVEADSERRR